jgi:hypothetical protein
MHFTHRISLKSNYSYSEFSPKTLNFLSFLSFLSFRRNFSPKKKTSTFTSSKTHTFSLLSLLSTLLLLLRLLILSPETLLGLAQLRINAGLLQSAPQAQGAQGAGRAALELGVATGSQVGADGVDVGRGAGRRGRLLLVLGQLGFEGLVLGLGGGQLAAQGLDAFFGGGEVVLGVLVFLLVRSFVTSLDREGVLTCFCSLLMGRAKLLSGSFLACLSLARRAA